LRSRWRYPRPRRRRPRGEQHRSDLRHRFPVSCLVRRPAAAPRGGSPGTTPA